MGDEWLSEDLPVLRAVRELEDRLGAQFRADDVVEVTGFDRARTMQLLMRLARAGYLDAEPLETMAGLRDVFVSGLAERGRRAVGQWPSEDPWAGLVDLLSRQIEEEPDANKRSKLVKFRDGVLASGRDVGVSLLTKFAEQQAGL